ncbi:molybdopterin-containing oxidoreductase family protein [Microvirga pudoricolor]|uniref:molybdopterin-containing oxidoreductase family protein n=1 Tax=Microvirga pudoricolor TaxID=2778729 RepID=UPI00195154E2|nr:molybdopterin oxidoreductase family protein [Microvirga pudoricolor]MBM6596092.1 molybdopterin oxidoreductase family protein [Microvirga pudoricolor]
MNQAPPIERRPSVCPHDCPSACSLDVEVVEGRSIGRVHGAKSNLYTAGVICAKVARYAERIHHPDRLLHPLKRTGPKGSGQFERVSWDEALDLVAQKFLEAERDFGTPSVWPYYYAGTMGLVMRDGINRLRHVKKYSGQYSTICTTMAWTGYIAGTGKLAGPDPREMAKSDCVVIWGTNPVHTQVNVMTHAMKARKERGAKIVAVDIYMNPTMKQADMALLLKPGTDGALACAVMHVLFRDGHADRDYLERYTDHPAELEEHLKSRDPAWASAITGLSVEEIEAFARLVGERKRTFFRLGYGFGRQRNGAVNMHAAASIAAVTGAWQYEGGGAFHNNGAIYHWNKALIEGHDAIDPAVRRLDQSQIGRVLTGDAEALRHGPPVKALLIQNTNPVSVAPEQELVKRGFAREDLFVCVHEQFMTETALMADVVLPATMFMEHDDFYQGGGHQYFQLGSKLVDAPGECRSNHEVIRGLASRLGAEHRGFAMEPREIIDWTLQNSGWGSIEELEAQLHIDAQPDFRQAHYLDGFAYPDGKFRFKPDWLKVPSANDGPMGPWAEIPALPDHWGVIENATEAHPFRLATSPARSFLNSTFTETPGSREKEGRPSVMIHPEDAARLGIGEGDWTRLRNDRGDVYLRAQLYEGVRRGVLIAESIWPNAAHPFGRGINTLTGADAVAPYGGAAFHDNRVAIERVEPGAEGLLSNF